MVLNRPAKIEFENFLKQQMNPDYKLGDITGTPTGDMEEYTRLKLAMKKEEQLAKAFYVDKQEEIEALEKKHVQERETLEQNWQVKEADFPNYTPKKSLDQY